MRRICFSAEDQNYSAVALFASSSAVMHEATPFCERPLQGEQNDICVADTLESLVVPLPILTLLPVHWDIMHVKHFQSR